MTRTPECVSKTVRATDGSENDENDHVHSGFKLHNTPNAARNSAKDPDALGLPSCITAVLRFLYFDLILPEDTFVMQLRKLFVASAMVITPFPQAYGITNLVLSSRTAAGIETKHVISFIAILIYTSIWPLTFVLLKIKPSFDTNLVAQIWFTFTLLGLYLQAPFYPDYPNQEAFFQLATAYLALRPHTKWFGLTLCGIGYAYSHYNLRTTVPGTCEDLLPMVAVPDPYRFTTAFEQIRAILNSGVILVLVLALVELQLREGQRLATAAAASAELAGELALFLARYDTDAAAARIAEAQREGTSANSDLLESFQAMVANLNSYRPHLPNWLLPTSHTVPGSDDGEGGAEARGSPRRDAQDDTTSTRSHASSRRSNSSRQGRQSAALARNRGDDSGVPSTAAGLSTAPCRTKVAMAEVNFAIADARELQQQHQQQRDPAVAPMSGAAALERVAAEVNDFVDYVYAQASAGSGAVHAFVGDTVTVTWNAASRVVQPETKAARFMVRVRERAAGLQAVAAWGSVAGGHARVQLAGSAGRQQSLLVSPEFRSLLRAARRVAARFRTFSATYAIYASANHAVEFCGIGAVSMLPEASFDEYCSADSRHAATRTPTTTTTVTSEFSASSITKKSSSSAAGGALFEVLKEHDEGAEEWLYVLEQQNNGNAVNPNLCRLAELTAIHGGEPGALSRLVALDEVRELLVKVGGISVSTASASATSDAVRWFLESLQRA